MSKALDRAYDGIIIGVGHHGLILGAYLAKAGLDILLVPSSPGRASTSTAA